MNLKAAMLALQAGIFLFLLMVPGLLRAQGAGTLSGTVTDLSGKIVAGANVAVKSATTSQSAKTQTDPEGRYSLPNLAPGNYAVSVSAQGFSLKEASVSISGAAVQTLDLRLNLSAAEQELPNAPSAAPASPSLTDLGFSEQQTKSNPQLQARLDKRTEMLKIHQRLGLITLAPMAADLITGPMAKAKGKNGQSITEPTQTNLDLHAALGSTTAALYGATAYFAIFAPKVPGVQKRGAIRVHEWLAFVHGPGMILTPILGGMAFSQEQNGEKVHGAASYHGIVAYATVIAYGASIIAVSWPIHLKFWKE